MDKALSIALLAVPVIGGTSTETDVLTYLLKAAPVLAVFTYMWIWDIKARRLYQEGRDLKYDELVKKLMDTLELNTKTMQQLSDRLTNVANCPYKDGGK